MARGRLARDHFPRLATVTLGRLWKQAGADAPPRGRPGLHDRLPGEGRPLGAPEEHPPAGPCQG
eukprot:4588502-Alexandrium_andersonii.AAC.1